MPPTIRTTERYAFVCPFGAFRARVVLLAIAVLCASTVQGLPAAQLEAALPDTSVHTPIFGSSDAALFAALFATSVVMVSYDADIRRGVTGFSNGATGAFADGAEQFGRSALWLQASAATFVTGKIVGSERVADVGLHALASLLLSNAVTWGLKRVAGRSRPYVVQGGASELGDGFHDPYAWKLFGGRDDASKRSYPSNHATTAFTLAGVLSEEFGGPVPYIAYPVATAVAWSRVYHDAHWASDVAIGALVGIFSARLVVRLSHRQGGPGERPLLFDTDPIDGSTRIGLRLALGN